MRWAALLALAVLLALAAPARGSGHGHAHKRRTSSLLTWLRRTSGQEELRAKQSQVSMAVEAAVAAAGRAATPAQLAPTLRKQ
jgi:hypothetical protein